MYNNHYGGFGFSDDFTDYNQDVKDYAVDRVEIIKQIKEYGASKYDQYKYFAQLATIYVHYELDKVFDTVYYLIIDKKTLADQHQVLNKFHTKSDDDFGPEALPNKDVIHYFYNDNTDKYINKFASQYSKPSLIWRVQEDIQKTEKAIEKHYSNIKQPRDIVDMMVDSYRYLFPEEIANNQKPFYERKPWNEKDLDKLTFIEAINHYQETHWAIWKCQYTFNEDVMRFLILHPHIYGLPHSVTKELKDKIVTKIGLMCASSKYCNLVIGEAPQLLHWYIGEYDGKESICVPDSQ